MEKYSTCTVNFCLEIGWIVPYFSQFLILKWIVYHFSSSLIISTLPIEQNLYSIFVNKYSKIWNGMGNSKKWWAIINSSISVLRKFVYIHEHLKLQVSDLGGLIQVTIQFILTLFWYFQSNIQKARAYLSRLPSCMCGWILIQTRVDIYKMVCD